MRVERLIRVILKHKKTVMRECITVFLFRENILISHYFVFRIFDNIHIYD